MKSWEIRIGGHGFLLLIYRGKVSVMMTSLPNIVNLGAQGLLMLIGSKFLLKITRLQNVVLFIQMFCGLVIFIKNFDPIDSYQEALSTQNNVLQ